MGLQSRHPFRPNRSLHRHPIRADGVAIHLATRASPFAGECLTPLGPLPNLTLLTDTAIAAFVTIKRVWKIPQNYNEYGRGFH